jgi:hypothetical protein
MDEYIQAQLILAVITVNQIYYTIIKLNHLLGIKHHNPCTTQGGIICGQNFQREGYDINGKSNENFL